MKILYMILMALFCLRGPVFAQDGPPGPDEIMAKMQEKLKLTQDQTDAVKPIVEKYSTKRQELRQNAEDGTTDRGSMRTQMKKLREDEGQELGQVLSLEQFNEWKHMLGGMHKHEGSGGNEAGPVTPEGGNGQGQGPGPGGNNPPS